MPVRPSAERDLAPALLRALSASLPLGVAMIGAVATSIAIAQVIGLSERATATWLLMQFGLPGVLTLAFSRVWHQPLLFIRNTTGIVLLGSFGSEFTYAQVAGATGVAGGVVLVAALFGLTTRVAALVPAPVVFGVIAGAILPLVVAAFDALAMEPVIVGGMLLAYAISRRLGNPRVPPIATVLAAGIVLAGLTGNLGAPAGTWRLSELEAIRPALSLSAVISIVPVLVPLIVLQGNLSSVVYLRSQGFEPPARRLDIVSGVTTAGSAVVGPVPVSLAGFATPLVAGPDAGEPRRRHWTAYVVGVMLVGVGIAAPFVAGVPEMVPPALLAALVGLAMLSVLEQAVREVAGGPRRLGPLVAFVVALSDLELLGLGPIFWALVLGAATARLLDDRA